MKKLTKKWITLPTLLIAVVAGALWMAGCGSNNLLGPVAPDNGGIGSNDGGATVGKGGHTDVTAASSSSTKLLDEDGGYLVAFWDGKACVFNVPEDALHSTATLSMSIGEGTTSWGKTVVFTFGPDGLVFVKPSKLSIYTSEPDGTYKRLLWWNPSTKQWELQGTGTVREGVVKFDIKHFSKYGIA